MPPDELIENGDWNSCKMYILNELKRMNTMHEKMDEKLDTIRDRITVIQVKVAGIAAAAGIIVTIVVNIIFKGIVK